MLWTRENTQSNPCPSNMDGKNTAFDPKKDVIDGNLTVYGLELVSPITDDNTNLTLIISGELKEPEEIQRILVQNNIVNFHSKFSASQPPPTVHGSIPFDYVGDPVYCPDGDYNATVHLLGWDNEVWATYREDDNVFAVRQSGTDRYWVDAAEGGASVPGAGENVFFENHATEDGVWNATTNWSATVGTATADAYVCTMDVNSAALGTFTMSYASATLAVVTYTLEHDGAGAISAGTVTVTTGKWQADGALALSGGTFLSASAHTLDCNSSFTISGSPTFNSATSGGAMTVAGSLTGSTTMTWNQGGCTTTLDGASQTLTGFGAGTATTVLGNVTFLTSTTLTVTGDNFLGSAQSIVCTFNMAGAISGSGGLYCYSSNANPIVATSMPTTWNSNAIFHIMPTVSQSLPAMVITSISSFVIRTMVGNKTVTMGGNITVTGGSTTIYDATGGTGGVLAQSTYALSTAAFSVGSGGTYKITHTISTGTVTSSGAVTVGTGSTLGSAAAAYTLDINGNFTNAGTTHLPNATGTCTFSGATWTETAAVTANSGLVTMDRAGTTTLGSAATAFYSVTVSNGTTLDTSAASNYSLTASRLTNIAGVLTCNNSTVTLGSGLTALTTSAVTITSVGVLTGGTGAHTYGSIKMTDTGAVYTATSGTTTLDGIEASGLSAMDAYRNPTFNHNNGTIQLTNTATLQIISKSYTSTGYTFYNLVINKTTRVANIYITTGYTQTNTIANNLTITSGTFNTTYGAQPNSGLTVTGATSVSGTLTTNTSTCTFNGTTVINAGGVMGGATAWTCDMNANLLASAGQFIAPTAAGAWTYSGATYIEPTTMTNSSGLCTMDLAGTTTLGSAATAFYSVTISNGTTFDTSAASNYAFTAAAHTLQSGGSIINCNASACTFGAAGYTADYGLQCSGTFNGGSGIHTAASCYFLGTVTLTSNTMTITGGIITANIAIIFNSAIGFSHGNGTVAFTRAGSQTLYDQANTARSLNNVIVNNATAAVQFYNAKGFALTCAGTLTITLGTFSTIETVSGVSRNLTVTSATSVSGTLTLNDSTYTAAAVTVNDGGLISHMTAHSTMSGNLVVGGGTSGSITVAVSASLTLNGTTTINAGATLGSAAIAYTLDFNANLLASAGTLILPTGSTTYGGLIWTTPTVLTASGGSVNFDSGGTCAIANDSTQFNRVNVNAGSKLDSSTFAFTAASHVTVGNLAGVQSWFYTTSGIKTIGGDLTINAASSTFGTDATAYNLVLTGNLAVSDGRLFAPTAAGSFTMAGATWNTPTGEFRHESGLVQFIRAGTTSLGNASTGFNAITVANGATLTCTATNYALTAAGDVTATGTLNGTGAAVTLKDLTITAATGVYTATTATTTITGITAGNVAWSNGNTFTNSNGSVDFTGATGTNNILGDNIWYNLEITTAAACTYAFEAAKTQTIASGGYSLLNGAVGQLLTLTSTTTTAWIFAVNALATYDFAYLSVSYSNATGRECETAFSTGGAGNTNWSFGSSGVYIWDGGGVGNLATTGGNWEGGVAPGVTSSVQFSSASVKNVTWDIVSTTGNITIYSDYTGTLSFGTDAVFNNLDIQGGTVTCGAYTIRTLLAFSQSGGVFTAPAAGDQLTISGNFTHSAGTWTHNSGLTVFNGTSQSITGSTTWASFTKSVTSADTLTIAASSTQTFVGNVTLAGAAGQLLSLVSGTPGTYWNFVMTAPAVKTSLQYLSVTDSDASGSDAAYLPIQPTASVNGGHTLKWFPDVTGGTSSTLLLLLAAGDVIT